MGIVEQAMQYTAHVCIYYNIYISTYIYIYTELHVYNLYAVFLKHRFHMSCQVISCLLAHVLEQTSRARFKTKQRVEETQDPLGGGDGG